MKIFLTLLILLLSSTSLFAQDEWDPEDDHFPTATDLGEPDTSLGTHGPHTVDVYNNTNAADRFDWFKFALLKDNFYEFVITNSELSVDLYMSDFASVSLLNPNVYTNNDNRIWFRPELDGIYYMKISYPPHGSYFLNYLQRPEPTPTPTPTITPTFTPEPTPTFTPVNLLVPSFHFEFKSDESYTRLSGGFADPPFPGGSVNLTDIPVRSNENITDGFGAEITLNPGELELIMMPEIQTNQKTVFIRVQALATNPDLSIALAVLEGNFDGSIGTAIPSKSENFIDDYNTLFLLYKSNTESIIPVIQVLNNGSSENAHVYIDNLEIYVLDEGVGLPSELINLNTMITPTPTP